MNIQTTTIKDGVSQGQRKCPSRPTPSTGRQSFPTEVTSFFKSPLLKGQCHDGCLSNIVFPSRQYVPTPVLLPLTRILLIFDKNDLDLPDRLTPFKKSEPETGEGTTHPYVNK